MEFDTLKTMRRPSPITWVIAAIAVFALVVLVVIAFVPHPFGPTATGTGDAAITTDQAETILSELKEIRRLLEKMEQQGGAQSAQRRGNPTTVTVSVEQGRASLGSAQAPVTVVEFTDYQCPFCRRFTQSTFPLLKRDYIDTGKVRWVVRDLPLALHAHARKAAQAAQAAHCAGEQGKFWEMRDVLFRNSANLGREQLQQYAKDIELNPAPFTTCLASDRHLATIDRDAEEAKRVRITGTPTFVIGKSGGDKLTGKMVIGAQAPAVFTAEIRRMLEQRKPAGNDPTTGAGDPG